MPDAARDEVMRTFYRVRQTLGYLGLFLPFLLILGGIASLGRVEPAISDYYHTLLRDVFVGIMSAIGLFLICYKGYQREGDDRVSDDFVTTIAGVAALGVALFPNQGQVPQTEALPQLLFGAYGSTVCHFLSAITFLGCLSYICLFKFTRTAKPFRRRIYRVCGITIILATILTIAASYFKVNGPAGPQQLVRDLQLVTWFETLGIWAFSLSWLIKGRVDESLARAIKKGAQPEV